MGFSSVTAQIIMFIAVMGFATGLVAVFNNYVEENTGAMSSKWQVMGDNLKTDITITSVTWDNDTNTTIMYIMNTGKTTMDPDDTDVYMDGIFIPRNTDNRTINVTSSTDVKNSGLWDPKEVLEVKVFSSLVDGTHYIDLGTQYGVVDTETFSVET